MNKKNIIATITIFMAINVIAQQNDKKAEEKLNYEIGNEMICPVSNEVFLKDKNTPIYNFNNKNYYFCCSECVEKFKKNPENYLKNQNNDAIIGNQIVCPVMKTRFIADKKTPKLEYKGKIYYFCCSECVEKFKKNPENYIKSTHKHNHKNMCNECEEDNKTKATSHTTNATSYSMDEVNKHNKKGDCWLVIGSKVYDVSEFSKKHNKYILLGCGKDATQLFEKRRDENGKRIGSGLPHSENARKLKEKFYIGELKK